MIRIDDIHATKLIAQAAHVQFVPKLHHCIADYDSNDCLRGGTLYADYWGGSVMTHFAGFRKRWITKQLLWLGFDYPFNQLKVKKIFGLIPEWNVQSRNVGLHLGYKIEYLTDDVFNFPDGVNGMYLMSMRKEACKWLDMPRPHIEFAPQERTNSFDKPLIMPEPVGMMQ
jgi:hypothetical protein